MKSDVNECKLYGVKYADVSISNEPVSVFIGSDFVNSLTHVATPYQLVLLNGARGGRGTVLRNGRLRVRFPMVSFEFFIDLTLPAAYGTEVDSASNRNE